MLRISKRQMTTEVKRRFLENLAQTANTMPKHSRLSSKIPSTMSVLVPLVEIGDSGELHAVFTKRSRHLKSHRGEVCFPGGKQEENETPEETAIRETVEEMGIDDSAIEIWGHLRPVVTRHLTSSVTPIVAFIRSEDYLKQLKVNHHEVQAVISAPLLNLAENVGYTQFRNPKMKYRIPVFRPTVFKVHDNLPDNYLPPIRIWGLSSIMLHQALIHLMPGKYDSSMKVVFY
ncbi:hypothetical protein WR25_06002 [Diploscapter pachys]|uniref:Nudix hydrolase domain-containing protein n=1 Tax=Diploscapter pachys TaxID=2018661 RepID=A0A2A2LQC1_9BILA|nr:hypothetical protein WR25_06002 [Diploscapter pachys]